MNGNKRGISTLEAAGFQLSWDGRRFKWKNTQSNRNQVRCFDDLYDAQKLLRKVQFCEHVIEEERTCRGCSKKLIQEIVTDIHKYASKSTFCQLDYNRLKNELNGTDHGLPELFVVGFVRSKSGHQLKWEDTQLNRACVASRHKKEQEQNMNVKQQKVEKEHPDNAAHCKHEIIKSGVPENIKVSAYESDEEQEEKIGNTLVRHMYRSIYVLRATNTMDEIMAMVKKHKENEDVEMKIEESSSS